MTAAHEIPLADVDSALGELLGTGAMITVPDEFDEWAGVVADALETALAAVNKKLHPFVVQVKSGPQVRISLDVLAPDRTTAQRQHEGLCEPGEQCIALTPDEWRDRQHRAPVETDPLRAQIERQSQLAWRAGA